VECKLRSDNFKRVSDPRRAFLPAFRVTGSTDNNPGSADNNPGSADDNSGSADDMAGSTWGRQQ
jgi:hypothetical protein